MSPQPRTDLAAPLSESQRVFVRQNGAARDVEREGDLTAATQNRGESFQAPERVHPAGTFTSAAEALAAWVLTAAHSSRHAAQIEEIVAGLRA